MPAATPRAEATNPRIAASSSTETYSCRLVAPMVRSNARVLRRCATSTWKVLAITKAATTSASTPNASRNCLVTSVPSLLIFLMASSAACWRESSRKPCGRSPMIVALASPSVVALALSMERYSSVALISSKEVVPESLASRPSEATAAPP